MEKPLFGVLKTWESLVIKGKDAPDFLHRLTTADFKRLQPQSFTPGALLQPSGKMILYFKAVRRTPDDYLILVPGKAQAGCDEFEKMHFREELVITPHGDEWAYVRALASDDEAWGKVGGRLEGVARLATSPEGTLTQLGAADGAILGLNENRWNLPPFKSDLGFVVAKASLAGVREELRGAGFIEAPSLEPYRVRAGDPAAPHELGPTTIPLEAQLDDAVHENKGCYPGQEVIERIRAMGQVPRQLAVVQGGGDAPRVPTTISVDGQDVGTLTSAEKNPLASGWVGLGFVKRLFAKSELPFAIGDRGVTIKFKKDRQ